MTRMLLPLSITDISFFAKKLKTDLDERADQGQSPPSHLELLNLLAPDVEATINYGTLVRLPNKFSVQQMAMWWMWTQFAVRRKYTEKEVNQVLNAHHTFGDQATLRRELVNMKLLGRKSDCSEYWKEPVRPSEEVQEFLRALRQAVAGAQPTKALTALTAPCQAHQTRPNIPAVN